MFQSQLFRSNDFYLKVSLSLTSSEKALILPEAIQSLLNVVESKMSQFRVGGSLSQHNFVSIDLYVINQSVANG